MVTLVSEYLGATGHAPDDGLIRCSTCDVTWRGVTESACWFCGEPGYLASETRRVVADETAA